MLIFVFFVDEFVTKSRADGFQLNESKCKELKISFTKSENPLEPITVNNTNIPRLEKIIWVIGVLRRTVVSDGCFDNLCGSHLQSQVIALVSWKIKNPSERFDWSIDRVAVGTRVMWLAVKTCAGIGYANSCKMNNKQYEHWGCPIRYIIRCYDIEWFEVECARRNDM